MHGFEKYVFKEYSEKYPFLFRRERTKIRKIIPHAQIDHIGSTSVPNLGGKGIIDIMVGVPKKELNKDKKILEENGYHYKKSGGSDERVFFERDYSYGKKTRRVHVHLIFQGSGEWIKALAVRNYLRTHPEETKKYAQIKKRGVKYAKRNSKRYKEYKTPFLDQLEKKTIR